MCRPLVSRMQPLRGRSLAPNFSQRFHLAPGLALGGGQKLPMVVRVEMLRQQLHRGQAHPAGLQQLEDDRETRGHAGCKDAVIGLVLREPEVPRAVDIHRRTARRQVEPAPLDLGQMDDDAYGRLPFVADEAPELCDELVIGNIR
jgi:hypothetical protein